MKCVSCGAQNSSDGLSFVCEYCGAQNVTQSYFDNKSQDSIDDRAYPQSLPTNQFSNNIPI